MKWTVVWKPAAQHDLTAIWLKALNRQAVTRTSAELDRLLQRDPLNLGESREGNERVVFVLPLAIRYQVSEADRLVAVQEVWTMMDV